MGPNNAWDLKTNSRGTQTDLVTDRNISDCLMELKSTPEFEDLSYRVSETCTGEPCITVVHSKAIGLLGAPLDPLTVTVTASGLCYFSVLFQPIEIINLKPGSELLLRKFRNVLRKLSGKAGFGFCSGFSQKDFPSCFDFIKYDIEVIHQPFLRIHSRGCPIFYQQRRPRVTVPDLGVELCPECLQARSVLNKLLKAEDDDKSASSLVLNNHVAAGIPSADIGLSPHESLSQIKGEPEPPGLKPKEINSMLVKDAKPVYLSHTAVKNEHESVSENLYLHASDPAKVKTETQTHLESTMLCDSSIPSPTFIEETAGIKDVGVSKEETSSPSSPPSSPPIPSPSAVTSTTSASLFSTSPSPMAPRSPLPSSPCPMTVGTVVTASANLSKTRDSLNNTVDNSLSQTVFSAQIRPFRAIASHIQESGGITADVVRNDVELSTVEMSMDGPLINGFGSSCKEDLLSLNSEDSYSPDSSPRPLFIDEDADCSSLQTTKYGELDAKQLCLRCSICQQVSTSQADLNRHVISHHNQSETSVDVNTTVSVFNSVITATTPSTTSQDKNGLKPVADNLHLGMENEAIDQVSKTCPVCKVQFADKSELEHHLIDKHGAKLHPCRYCGQKFALKNNLTSHLQRHRGHTTLKCNECGAKFSKRKVFAAHIRQHMGSFPYFCTICTKLFSLETSFEKHMKRHKARRSTGVLAGNERTVHGILVKAKKLLDEKFQLEQLSLSANSKQGKNSPLPSSENVCKNSEEVDAKKPECLEQSLSFTSESHDSVAQSPKATLDQKNIASSNLHLLSVVSVAQAELLGTYSANSAPNELKQRTPEYLKPHLIDNDIISATDHSVSLLSSSVDFPSSLPVPSPSRKTKIGIDPHSQNCEISESERSDIVLNCDVSASQGKIGSLDFPSPLPVPPPLRKTEVGIDLHLQNCEISESERTNIALNCDVPTSPEKMDANLIHNREENMKTGMQIGQIPEFVSISDDCSVKCDQNSTSTVSSLMIDVQTCVNLANVENKMAEKVEQEQYKKNCSKDDFPVAEQEQYEKKCSNTDIAATENIIEDNNSKLVLQEDSSKDLQKRPKTLLQRLSAPPLSLPRPVSGIHSSAKSFMEASEWSEMQPDILPIDGFQQKTSGENAEENEIQQKSPSVMPSCLTVEAGMTEMAQKLMEQEQRLAKKEKELKEREAAIALKDRQIQQRLMLAKVHSLQQKCSNIKESSTVGSLSGAFSITHTIPQMQTMLGAHSNNSISAIMPGRSHKIHPIVSRAVSGTGSMQLQNLPPPPPPPYPSQVTSSLRPVGHLAPQYMNPLIPGTREVMNTSLTHISPPAVQKSHTQAIPSSQVQGSHCITAGTQPLTVATSEANFSLPSSWKKTTLILNGSTSAPPPLVSSTLTYSPDPFGSVLKEMMRLEAKMPETAKKFLPSYGTRKQSSKKPPVQLSCLKETKDLSTVSSAGFTSPNIPDMVLSLASNCTSDSNRKQSSKGRQSLNDIPFSSVFAHSSCNDGQHQASGSDAKNRRHQWSGGIFKEKSSSVPVAVSPSEMQRLLTLVSSSSSPSHSDVVSTLSPPMPLPMPPPPPYPSSCQPAPVCSQKAIQPSLSLPSSLNSHPPLILSISAVPTTTPSLFTTSPVTASGVTPRFLLQSPLSTPPGAVLHRNMQTTLAPSSFDAVPRLPSQPASFSVLHHNNQHIFSSPVTSTITTNLTVTSPRLPFSSSSHSQGSHSSFISSPASSGPPPLWMPGRKRTPVSTARASADDMVPIDLTKPKHVTSAENKKQNHNSNKNNNESPSTESSLLLRQCLMMSPLVDRSHFANSESSPQTAEYSHSELPTNQFGPPPIVRFPLSSHPVTNPHATLISKGIGSSENRSTEYAFSPASPLSSKTSSLSQGILTSQKNMAPLVAQSQDVLQNHDVLQHGIVSPSRNGISRTQDATSVPQRVLSPHRSVRIPTSGILSPHGVQQEVLHPPCVPSPHCALSPVVVTSTQNVTTHPRMMFPDNSAPSPSGSGHRSSVPNFLQLPSFSANIGQKDVHGFNLDKCSLSNPLGGFAWHKPEIGGTSEQSPDVFIHESSSENKSYQRETITLEGNANEPEINMVDARCLEVTEKGEVWQRQFLTALQQNRQQKQQQQEKQQQSQIMHQQERQLQLTHKQGQLQSLLAHQQERQQQLLLTQQQQLAQHQQERQQQLQLTQQQERQQQLQLTHHHQGQQQSQFTHQQERQQQHQLAHQQERQQQSQFTHQQERQQHQLAHQQERQQQSQLMQHQQERQQQSQLTQHQQKSEHQSQLTHQQREHQHSQFLCEQDKLQQPLLFQHQQERQQHSYVVHQQEQQVQPVLYQQETQQQAQHRQEIQQTQLMHDLQQRPEEPIQQNQHSHSKDSPAMELQPELGSKLRRTRRSRKRLVEKSEEKHPEDIEYSKKREHYRVDTTGKDLRIRLVSAEGRPPKHRRKNGTSRKDGKEEGHDVVESNVIDGKPEEVGEKIIHVTTGRDAEAKVEPTVSCDACGKVFFNELDILEHECDVE